MKPKDDSSTESTDNIEVIKDYGVAVGRIVKVDLSSNGLLQVIASAAASD